MLDRDKTKQEKDTLKTEISLFYIPWSVMISCNGGFWIPTTTLAIVYSQTFPASLASKSDENGVIGVYWVKGR